MLRSVLQPQTVFLSDEGGNGIYAHVCNERGTPLSATLSVHLYRDGATLVASRNMPITLAARESRAVPLIEMFDSFMDLSHAYRFGPAVCDVIAVTLEGPDRAPLARDFHFPLGLAFTIEHDVGLSALARYTEDGSGELVVESNRVARFVTIRATGFVAEEQYFHLAPGMPRAIRMQRAQPARELQGHVSAMNSRTGCRFEVAA